MYGPDLDRAERLMAIVALVAIPFAIWKAIDLMAWLIHHLHFGATP